MTDRTTILSCLCLTCLGAGATLELAGCSRESRSDASSSSDASANVLTIRWQRLVDTSGQTCDRCGNTERAISEAEHVLAAALKPLGLRVSVVKSVVKPEQFALDASQSNRIWIGEELLDTILGAKEGASSCTGVCGDSSCRTLVVDGRTYETIPPQLIIRAGLKVAADMIQPAPTNGQNASLPCCGSPTSKAAAWTVENPFNATFEQPGESPRPRP